MLVTKILQYLDLRILHMKWKFAHCWMNPSESLWFYPHRSQIFSKSDAHFESLLYIIQYFIKYFLRLQWNVISFIKCKPIASGLCNAVAIEKKVWNKISNAMTIDKLRSLLEYSQSTATDVMPFETERTIRGFTLARRTKTWLIELVFKL